MLRRHQKLPREGSEEGAKFRALVEQLPVTTYIHSLDHPGRTLYVSDQIRELSGFLPEEVMEDDALWDSRIPEPHRSEALAAAEHHKRSGQPLALEYPFVTRHGETIWIGHRARVVHGDNGRPLYTEGIVFDITVAKEREKPLLQRMKVLETLFESAPVGVTMITSGGRPIGVNPTLERMLGYAADELATMSLDDVLTPDAAADLQACLLKTLRGELRPHQTEVELIARSGDVICANVTMLTVPSGEDDEASSVVCVILEDITERRRSRQELKETVDQLQGVISNLPVIVFTYDDELRLSMLEGRGATEFGTDLSELVGLPASEILANLPEALQAVKSALAGEHQHIVLESGRLGGWWEVWYSPLRAADDSIVGVLGVAANVSERVGREQALARSMSLLNTTFDAIADAVVASDLEGELLTYNKQFASMWGVSPDVWEEWDSTRQREQIFQQIKEPAYSRDRAAEVESDPESQGKNELELHDGRLFESRFAPQRVGGKVIGRVVTFRDITEQRRATALLEDQARILKEIARDAPLDDVLDDLCRTVNRYNGEVRCSVCITDENKILVPRAAPGLMGFYEDLGPVHLRPPGRSWTAAARRGDRFVVEDVLVEPGWESWIPAASRHGLRSGWSEPIRSSAGLILGRFALYHSQPRTPSDDEVAIVELLSSLAAVAIERDLAARNRRELEDRVRQAQKMEVAGQLSRGFAHDLGNILTAINLNGELLRHEVTSEGGQEALDDLEKAASMAGHLVNDLLNLMRPPYPELVDINALVHGMSSLLRTVVKDSVTLQIRTEAVRACAEVDVSQFHQVLLNLVMNANEAMPDGGVITIRTTDGAEARSLTLSVEDDGIGMDVDTLEQAFDPFFTTKRGGGAKGIGLGLASANSAVTAVGGHITIDSVLSRGTQVRVHLPSSEEEIDRDVELIVSGGADK